MRSAIAFLAGVAVAASASAMPVSTFLTKVDALKSKGPFALFSGDLKLLSTQMKTDLAAIRSERLAAQAAGRPTAFCPPAGGAKLTDKDVVDAMQAVPLAQRAQTETKDAMRAYLARRFPCRA
jgi:hypothetical protein